jgi:hypothetical protein
MFGWSNKAKTRVGRALLPVRGSGRQRNSYVFLYQIMRLRREMRLS